MKNLACIAIAVLAACGSSHSSGNTDSNNGSNSDGNGNGSDGTSGGPATVTVTLTNHPSNAAMFSFLAAYQDGSGAWQLAPAPSGDTYTLTINSAAWSFAWTCVPPAGGAARVELASFAVSEKTSLTETIPFGCTDVAPPTAVSLTGTVTNIPQTNGGAFLLAIFGNARFPAQVNVNAGTGTYMMNVPPATHDIIVYRVVNTGGFGGNTNVDAVAVARAVAVSGATVAPPIDFANASVATATDTITTTGTMHNATTRLFSAGGTQVSLASDNASPYESDALPAAIAATGDVYDQSMTVTENGATSTIQSWTATIAAQTYSAPTALGGATSSVPATTPYPEVSTSWNAYAGADGYTWNATQGGGTGTGGAVVWHADLGPGVVGGSPKFQMPDLSALTGWSTSLQFMTGSPVNGLLTAWTSTGGIADFPVVDAVAAPAGTMRTSVDSRWTVTP